MSIIYCRGFTPYHSLSLSLSLFACFYLEGLLNPPIAPWQREQEQSERGSSDRAISLSINQAVAGPF